ncbi:Lar family restriction alleviation protein [Devosia ginsengisoli]|uniref:Restriction alleviation protein, Lar family n=1 Tax=Devosia ginsengisoli TaxID=400770 RepID=A0A5B8LST8_9HYPH|nr:Lar family restriction alleviation protein [Devosia ginsengisoli]QDZ10562.1 hypothetical protein FPZ08_07235 [Devosia ginsengisoli]
MTVDANRVSLLPCPFCGDQAFAGTTLDNSHYVMCRAENCWAMTGYLPTQSEAIAAWNCRSPSLSGGEAGKWVQQLAARITVDVCEIERNSPEDDPMACIVYAPELTDIIERRATEALAAVPVASPAPDIIAAKDAEIDDLREIAAKYQVVSDDRDKWRARANAAVEVLREIANTEAPDGTCYAGALYRSIADTFLSPPSMEQSHDH